MYTATPIKLSYNRQWLATGDIGCTIAITTTIINPLELGKQVQ